ncbi:MAG: 50S ribosomal protein L22 [Candidatus Nealsonbacteria bacterium CG_4_10_14_0_8_um_filter_35_10]|uniref:Large ribosomal subunit protein uL22 n=2 Tax=Candidatus Nealsoniibacteriota TaxID=1817911 RepID=A0A2M7R830_9BACT|nr:MAG: 50S ribosomal protein L22 [Candidatus Nealsonbacteria bacterium CG_4_10_14_0_8_um_filter_35_10]PJB99331.1 MAG: 50S ribosomal protein L22 [Candidatus Nealsonbacteria bacterium CG_4_9_14_0_8_um_filter_35_12]
MIVTAKLKYLRIAPRKVKLVADLIRGKKVSQALNFLEFLPKKSALPFLKLLKQAIANAKHNFQLDESNLYISKILVDEGPKLKRQMPRARGQADEIYKRTSHISLVLNEIEKKPKEMKEIKEIEKKEKIKKIPKVAKPQFRPELEKPKPKIEKGFRRIFRRKAI